MEQMAEAIDAVEQTSYSSIAKVPEREHYPVSSAQKRLLILNELVGAGTAYNMPFVLQLTGELDRARLLVPVHWVFMDQLPLTPNGKVHLQALPEPVEANEIGRAHV